MFKRAKRLLELSKKDPAALKVLESLSEEQLKQIPEIGDGKAEFFGEGSEAEFKDFEREEQGTKPWYDRLNEL